jgi:DNA modification methylase
MDKIIQGDCVNELKKLKDCSVDMVLTSPPYDDLRTYGGYSFEFEPVARELYRVMKHGGVVVWVVNDATLKGSETGTSFRQALYFKDTGFNLHDTMIWQKKNPPPQTREGRRYTSAHEYMFVLVKGRLQTFNELREPCTHSGKVTSNRTQRSADGTVRADRTFARRHKTVNLTKPRRSVWDYACTGNKQHPAAFPEALARDHIISWSNPGDLVLDPFAGSGTTLKMARHLKRRYLGIEISKEYVVIARARLKGQCRATNLASTLKP